MEKPTCKMCGAPVSRFIKSTNKWWSWCSNKCMGTDPEILLKKQQTNNTKFGSHPMQNDIVKQRLKDTYIQRLGVDNPSKSAKVKEKMKSTFVANYGVDNPSKNAGIIERIKNDAIVRYATCGDEIIRRRKLTNLTKYGVETNKHIHILPQNIALMKDIEWLKEQHYSLKKPFSQIASELGCSPTPLLCFFTNSGYSPNRFNTSIIEIEIQDYISSLGATYVSNTRSIIPPHEIDILIPDINLALEIDGVYWHSELHGKDNKYHLSKTLACKHRGIQLWHVFDSEWTQYKEIVKSKIAGALHKHTKIPARKCTVKLLDRQEKTQFINQYHLQGDCGSKVNLGLFCGDELVMVTTFGTSRYTKTAEWELIRLCSKSFVTVQGGANKLFQYFIRHYNPKSVVSYADQRWSSGAVYEKLGFKLSHISAPNYYYFKSAAVLESRVKYQKHKLSSIFNNVDPALTEWEIMQQNGYNRIWDCGNMVFIWST